MRSTALALVILAAACGGGLTSSSTSGPTDDLSQEGTTDQAEARPESSTTSTSEPRTSVADDESDGDEVEPPDPEDLAPADENVEPSNEETTTVPADPQPSEKPANAGPFVEAARADLAQRLSVAAGEIEVLLVEQVTWRNSALGCPQPDRAYLDVLTPGQRTVLTHGGLEYHYHGGEQPFPCDAPEEPLPPSADPNS